MEKSSYALKNRVALKSIPDFTDLIKVDLPFSFQISKLSSGLNKRPSRDIYRIDT